MKHNASFAAALSPNDATCLAFILREQSSSRVENPNIAPKPDPLPPTLFTVPQLSGATVNPPLITLGTPFGIGAALDVTVAELPEPDTTCGFEDWAAAGAATRTSRNATCFIVSALYQTIAYLSDHPLFVDG